MFISGGCHWASPEARQVLSVHVQQQLELGIFATYATKMTELASNIENNSDETYRVANLPKADWARAMARAELPLVPVWQQTGSFNKLRIGRFDDDAQSFLVGSLQTVAGRFSGESGIGYIAGFNNVHFELLNDQLDELDALGLHAKLGNH